MLFKVWELIYLLRDDRPVSSPWAASYDQSVLRELPPQLMAEIESTMPLCERVKMNKRRRSTVNDKPKYAEASSEEETEAFTERE